MDLITSLNKALTPRGLSFLLFLVLVVAGLYNYNDFGMSWDEPAQRLIGSVSYNYLVHDDPQLFTFRDRDYGVAFELPLIILEKITGFEDTRAIYLMRHLVSHLFFLFCLYFGYWLVFRIFNNKWLAVVAVLLFVLHPVIYAHSFFNTKDIPFMGMFMVCFLCIHRAFSNYRILNFLWLGAAMGILINLRIMGLMLFFIVVAYLAVDAFQNRRNQLPLRRILTGSGIFVLTAGTTLYLTWPLLYHQPFKELFAAFTNMSKFRWGGDVLYLGELIKASELPWHYALVWFSTTTPIWYLVLGLSGILMLLYTLVKHPKIILNNNAERHFIIYLAVFITPLILVVLLNSVLYDSWRHLFFIYPAFVMLAVSGLNHLSMLKRNKLIPLITVAAFVFAFHFEVSNHPHQHVYFNQLVNRSILNHERKLLEADYWGVSYRQGLEAILETDKSDSIKVQVAHAPGKYNLDILNPEDRSRIVLVEENPKYFISNYRYHPEDYPIDPEQEIYSITVQNNTILSVFKLRE